MPCNWFYLGIHAQYVPERASVFFYLCYVCPESGFTGASAVGSVSEEGSAVASAVGSVSEGSIVTSRLDLFQNQYLSRCISDLADS